MQAFFAHPAIWRGLLLFAGMLSRKFTRQLKADPVLPSLADLVS